MATPRATPRRDTPFRHRYDDSLLAMTPEEATAEAQRRLAELEAEPEPDDEEPRAEPRADR